MALGNTGKSSSSRIRPIPANGDGPTDDDDDVSAGRQNGLAEEAAAAVVPEPPDSTVTAIGTVEDGRPVVKFWIRR